MKKNFPLIVAIALPVIFIIILFFVVAVPPMFMHPQHNFLYVINANSSYNTYSFYKNKIIIENNKIILEPIATSTMSEYPNATVIQDTPTMYLYNVAANTSSEISFADAQKLTLDANPTSSDGYTVGYKYNDYSLFDMFGGGNNNEGYYISKGNNSRSLVGVPKNTYMEGFQFLAWVQ